MWEIRAFEGKEGWLGDQGDSEPHHRDLAWVGQGLSLALPFGCCVTLGKSLYLSEPHMVWMVKTAPGGGMAQVTLAWNDGPAHPLTGSGRSGWAEAAQSQCKCHRAAPGWEADLSLVCHKLGV